MECRGEISIAVVTTLSRHLQVAMFLFLSLLLLYGAVVASGRDAYQHARSFQRKYPGISSDRLRELDIESCGCIIVHSIDLPLSNFYTAVTTRDRATRFRIYLCFYLMSDSVWNESRTHFPCGIPSRAATSASLTSVFQISISCKSATGTRLSYYLDRQVYVHFNSNFAGRSVTVAFLGCKCFMYVTCTLTLSCRVKR